jgi:hypothetical protein
MRPPSLPTLVVVPDTARYSGIHTPGMNRLRTTGGYGSGAPFGAPE